MRESDCSSIISDDVWYLSLANSFLGDFAKLESSFLSVNSMRLESTFDVIKNSEMFISLFNSDNVHLTEWESWVSSDLTVDFDISIFVSNDLHGLLSGKSVLKLLLKKNVKWDTFSSLMWTSGWLGSIHSLEFTKVPLLWSINSLHNLSLSFIALKRYGKYRLEIDLEIALLNLHSVC